MNAQDAANSLWALAVLDVSDEAVIAPLAAAVSRLSAHFTVTNAQQVLQAHFGGVTVDAATVARCWALVRAHPEETSAAHTTGGQRAVASALARLGLETQLEAPALEGLLSVDIVARMPGDAAGRAIAVEFDGAARSASVCGASKPPQKPEFTTIVSGRKALAKCSSSSRVAESVKFAPEQLPGTQPACAQGGARQPALSHSAPWPRCASVPRICRKASEMFAPRCVK